MVQISILMKILKLKSNDEKCYLDVITKRNALTWMVVMLKNNYTKTKII